ncbi:MAG: hypothetical protein COA69_05705 [Robiginitomaculum sp.]|nr:MAG: hypothetical protein COA69_05705 [Robiginitomaculum sp.]
MLLWRGWLSDGVFSFDFSPYSRCVIGNKLMQCRVILTPVSFIDTGVINWFIRGLWTLSKSENEY